MKIEVGMLVQIVDSPKFKHPNLRKNIGHIGKVTELCSCGCSEHWLIDGVDGAYLPRSLLPINPDSQPADEDFQEDLKRWLDKKVTA